MNIQEKKHIVQKLLSGTLSEEEKARLSQSPEMEQIWLQQWEQASDKSQEVNPDQLWAGIRQQTGQKNRPWKSYFYKWYSVAASILLVIALSGINYLWNQKTAAPVYVVTSGIQNLEKIQLPDGTHVCLGPGSRIHFSHSYVRGNWNNSAKSTPAVISKSCHDLDILRWIIDKPCKEVTAFGDLSLFKKAKAPKEATKRCLDCPIERQCAFSAKRIYYDNRSWLYVFDDLKDNKEEQGKQILSYLRTTDYGRCVYYSDNDQPDHFIMNMKFEGGITAAFSMEALTSYGGRRTRIMGTKGDIVGDMVSFTCTDFLTGKQEKWGTDINDGHGGGDLRLIRDLLWAVDKKDESLLTSSIAASIESHVMGFRGEQSRLKGTIEKL